MSGFPLYRIPPNVLYPLAVDWLRLHPRSFHADAVACVSTLSSALRIFGAENVPQTGPALVVFNHYARPGFGVWWLAMAIISQLPESAHLIITGELTRWYPPFGRYISILMLSRLAQIYGFTAMPPMPPRPQDVEARARAVRRVLEYVKAASSPILVLAPEGRDNLEGSGALDWPPLGAGRFISLLAARGLKIVPVGGWEQDGGLFVRFGLPFTLDLPAALSADERDRLTAETVMRAIAALLPAHLRGPFEP